MITINEVDKLHKKRKLTMRCKRGTPLNNYHYWNENIKKTKPEPTKQCRLFSLWMLGLLKESDNELTHGGKRVFAAQFVERSPPHPSNIVADTSEQIVRERNESKGVFPGITYTLPREPVVRIRTKWPFQSHQTVNGEALTSVRDSCQ